MAKGLYLRTKETGANDSVANIPVTHPVRNPTYGDKVIMMGGDYDAEVMFATFNGISGGVVNWNILGSCMRIGNIPGDLTLQFKGWPIPDGWVALGEGDCSIYTQYGAINGTPGAYDDFSHFYHSTDGKVYTIGDSHIQSLDISTFEVEVLTARIGSRGMSYDDCAYTYDGSYIWAFGNNTTAEVDYFNIGTGVWTNQIAHPLPSARQKAIACYCASTATHFLVGGLTPGTSNGNNNLWEYNSATGWTNHTGTAPFPQNAKWGMSCIGKDGLLYVLANVATDTCYMYSIDPANIAGGWSSALTSYTFNEPVINGMHYCSSLDILVIIDGTTVKSYDFALDAWSTVGLTDNGSILQGLAQLDDTTFFKGDGTSSRDTFIFDALPSYTIERG